jgi:hypothetical protein
MSEQRLEEFTPANDERGAGKSGKDWNYVAVVWAFVLAIEGNLILLWDSPVKLVFYLIILGGTSYAFLESDQLHEKLNWLKERYEAKRK